MDVDTIGTFSQDAGTPTADTAPQAPASAPAAPEPSYEISVGGQTVKVSLDELKKGYLRQSDYTRKTTEHAERLKMLPRYEQAIKEAQGFLQDPQRIAQYYQQAFGRNLEQAGQNAIAQGADPDDVRQLLAQMREEMRRELASGMTQLQAEYLGNDYKRTIDSQLDRILGQHPELKGAFGDRAGKAIKQLVAAARPKSIEEAIALMEEEANGLSENLKGFATSQAKSAATAQGNPLSRGIEAPRTGAPPESAPQKAFKKVSDPELRAQVMADLERLSAGSP